MRVEYTSFKRHIKKGHINKKSSLLLVLAAAGCTEFDVTPKNNFDDLQNDGVPVIIVDPAIINFPNLDASADLEATEVVTVTNEGTNVLKIDEIYLQDANLPYIIQPISSP